MIKKFVLIALLIFFLLPATVFAQSSQQDQGILDSLAGGISQLISGNNPVHLENPKNNFAITEIPQFLVVAPQAEEIQAKIIRKTTGEEVNIKVDKTADNKFQISFIDQIVVVDNYQLDLVAKESFFYNRHIILDFSWGPSTSSGPNNQTSWLKSFLEEKPDHKNMKIIKSDANSVHFLKPDGKIEANFTEKPINYLDAKGEWKPIDTALKEKDGVLTGDGVPVKISKAGEVKVDNSKHSQKTTRFGYFNPENKTFSKLTDLPEGKIENNQFIRETKEFRHVLTLLDSGLKEELTLFSPPTTSYQLPATAYLVLETEVTGIDLPDGWVDEFKIKDTTFPLPETKDAAGKKIETKRYAVKINGKQYIYTGIPTPTLLSSPYPITIDPDFTGGTADGYIRCQDYMGADAWTYCRANSESYDITSTTAALGTSSIAWNEKSFTRQYLVFDTSSIGSGSTVTQVNLTRTKTSANYTFTIYTLKQDWSAWAADPTNATKRETAYDNTLTATKDTNFGSTGDMTLNTPYTSANMDTTWINKTGSTYYSQASANDYDNVVAYARDSFAFADHTTASYRPVLTVLYEAAATPTPTPTPTPLPPGLRFKGLKLKGLMAGTGAVAPTPTPTWTCGQNITDSRDSKVYTTVLIGTQCWMAQNLNVGTKIAGAGDQGTDCSSAANIQKYCYGDSDANCTTYGGLYQWAQTMCGAASCNGTGSSQPACASPVQGICPTGWHIPSHYEWALMELAICTSGTCATDFPYDTSTTGWRGSDEGTNLKSGGSSGFNGLQSGRRNTSGTYDSNVSSFYWASLQSDSTNAWFRSLTSTLGTVRRFSYEKACGHSIRCVKNP